MINHLMFAVFLALTAGQTQADDGSSMQKFMKESSFFVDENTDLLKVQKKIPPSGTTEFDREIGFLDYGHGMVHDSRIIHGRKRFADGFVSFVLESYYPLLRSREEV